MEDKAKRAKRSELLKELIGMYHPQSAGDISTMLRDLFAGTMEDMLKAELEAKLGYQKNDPCPKETENRRNGSYPKTVHSSLGESRIRIPRDRAGDYEPILIPKGNSDVSDLEGRFCRSMPREQATGISLRSYRRSTASH